MVSINQQPASSLHFRQSAYRFAPVAALSAGASWAQAAI